MICKKLQQGHDDILKKVQKEVEASKNVTIAERDGAVSRYRGESWIIQKIF